MKKRWRIIAIVLLSLIGLTWWKLSTPPAFAQFVYKAGGKVELLDNRRIRAYHSGTPFGTRLTIRTVPDFPRSWTYQTTASFQSVMLALGDQIGEENAYINSYDAGGSHKDLRFDVSMFYDGASTRTLIKIKEPVLPTALDSSISKIWSGWIEFRYGKLEAGAFHPLEIGYVGPTTAELNAIKKLRPKMKEAMWP